MLDGKKIVVIQNTDYHFETALSIYKSLEDAGAEVLVRQMCRDRYGQRHFMNLLGMRLASESDLEGADCAFVVSAYPNPYTKIPQAVPGVDNPDIQMFGDRIVYISHRFGKSDDYNSQLSPVRQHNTVCLSPLSSSIGIDHIYPIDMPIKPEKRALVRPIQFCIQGHFELNNRAVDEWVFSIEDGSNRANIVFLGGRMQKNMSPHRNKKNTIFLPNQQESSFYKIINRHTNFILPMIDESLKGGTYLKERFSSNFNQAFALEKPVICHEDFKEIYGTPGFYYNDKNQMEVAERVLKMTQGEYDELVGEFAAAKKVRRDHNNRILTAKVEAVCG